MQDPESTPNPPATGEDKPGRIGLAPKVKVIVFAALLLGCGAGAVFLWRAHQESRSHLATASCANHIIQLSGRIRAFLEQRKPYPATADALEALEGMVEEEDARWLRSSGAACPESFWRDRSLGYVYLADGLPWKSYPDESGPLVLVCPAASHQGESQHAHAIRNGEFVCLGSNLKVISLLEAELARAGKGVTGYSSRAIDVMRRELAARREFESRR